MLTIPVYAGVLERMLNEGLCVLTPEETRPLGERDYEGELFRMEENNGDSLTGRVFFARGMHDLGGGYVQVTLEAYMEDINPESGKPERMPMAGSFENEKAVIPGGETMVRWSFKVKGERPLWVFRDVKWRGEYSIVEYEFDSAAMREFEQGRAGIPSRIALRIQAQGGESIIPFQRFP